MIILSRGWKQMHVVSKLNPQTWGGEIHLITQVLIFLVTENLKAQTLSICDVKYWKRHFSNLIWIHSKSLFSLWLLTKCFQFPGSEQDALCYRRILRSSTGLIYVPCWGEMDAKMFPTKSISTKNDFTRK